MPPRVLAVFAHPDDESAAFAGTAMKLIDAGGEVGLLTLTRGGKEYFHLAVDRERPPRGEPLVG